MPRKCALRISEFSSPAAECVPETPARVNATERQPFPPIEILPPSATLGRMEYRVTLMKSDEGWSVSCPSLPGCHSQGSTREEAIENIRAAIREWLAVEAEENGVRVVEEALVTV